LQQRTEIPPPIAKRAPGAIVPVELEKVVTKLLEKDPKERYANANDVIAALDAAMLSKGFETVPEVAAADRISALPAEGHVAASEPYAAATDRDQGLGAADVAPLDVAPGAARGSESPREASDFAGGSVENHDAVAGRVNHAEADRGAFSDPAERAARLSGVAGLYAALPASDRFPRWAYLALPAAGVVLLAVFLLLRGRSSSKVEGEASEVLATGEVGEAAPAGSAREVTMEVGGLDASGWRMNLRNAVRKKEWPNASEAVLTLMRLDPPAFRDHDVQGALRTAAVGLEEQGGEPADKFWGALSQGAEGLDLVYDVARNRPGTKAGKRATEILRRPEVMMLGSPALKVLFDYREASCVGRRDLFARMADQGDERALSELVQTRDADCGRRDPCCYKENRALGTAIKALKTRLTAPPPAPPQAP
jgi:serine/threonine-protein kinase